jgi:predicted dehydrogenase
MVLRIGLIGSGIVTAKAHLPALIRDPRFRITALCRRDVGKLQGMQTQFPTAEVFTDAEALIGSGAVDCVLVAADVSNHLDISQMVIDHRLHGLIEKPVGPSAASIRSFIESNPSELDRLMVAFNKRYYTGIAKFDELRLQEQLSSIIGGTISFLTRQGRKEGKAGILQNLIHTCDLVCHMFGKPLDVSAMFSKALNDERRGKTIAASVLTDRGCAVNLFFTSSSNWNVPVHEQIVVLDDRSSKLSIEDSDQIVFSRAEEDGSIRNTIFRESNSIFWRYNSFGYETQISAFGDLIEAKNSGPVANFHDALAAQELFEKIFKFDPEDGM